MSFQKKLRRLWHDTYYAVAGQRGVNFALRCREFVARVDTSEKGTNLTERARYFLHASLCQTCRNYKNYSRWLHREASASVEPPVDVKKLKELNRKLLEKFSHKNKS